MGRDTYSESYTSRQEIVRFTPAPRPRFESMQCLRKRKAPVAGGFQFRLVRRIGFRASAARIRTGSPACRRARPLATDAPRPLHARASTEVRIHAVLT